MTHNTRFLDVWSNKDNQNDFSRGQNQAKSRSRKECDWNFTQRPESTIRLYEPGSLLFSSSRLRILIRSILRKVGIYHFEALFDFELL